MNFNIELPKISSPVANYKAYKIINNLLYISGQTCRKDNQVIYQGKVGVDLNIDTAKQAARLCGLNILAQVHEACNGDFSKIISCIRLNVYINCNADFSDHAKVANGASDLMVEVFGEIGIPTRSTIGVNSLPSNSAIEIDAIFALK